ncbi:MAG: DUF2344 domain-containing protein [bacterium]|nr:DUF2344 domain-containing protein [bacterium]
MKSQLTESCDNPCKDYCGVCNSSEKVRYPQDFEFLDETIPEVREGGEVRRILFSFAKRDSAIFFGHLNIMHMFGMAFQRSSIRMHFSKGYNPKPKMEFPHPLTLGISSEEEIVGAEIYYNGENLEDVVDLLNTKLPDGIFVTGYNLLPALEEGRKYKSLMAQYWGSKYLLQTDDASEYSLDYLFDSLNQKVLEFGVVDDYEIEKKDDGIEIVSEMKNKKMNNIVRILAEIVGEVPLSKKISMTRLKIYRNDGHSRTAFV